jgi:hypothetical protein
MPRHLRLLLCASAAALVYAAAPGEFPLTAARAQVAVAVSTSVAPPLLPVYAQPPIPGSGYLWVPGYWAWDGQEYYWVPGYWTQPPAVGLLWTPGYWAWSDAGNDYVFYDGYWAPTVGFYGGVDYGFGYTGEGYYGGYWRGPNFFYNQAVNNVANAGITNLYSRPAPSGAASRVSFSGGQGGVKASPTPTQLALARGRHDPPTAAQTQHQQAASRIPSLKYAVNHGKPPIAAAPRAGELSGAPSKPVAAAGAAAAGAAAAAAKAHAAAAATKPPEHAPAAAPGLPQRAAAGPAPVHAPRFPASTPATPRFAGHAAPMHAPAFRPSVTAHAPMRAPAFHPSMAAHAPMRAPAFHPSVAAHAPMRPPAFHPNVVTRAPPAAFHPNVAHGAPALGPGGGMRFGGPPHIAGAPRVGGPPGGAAHGPKGGPGGRPLP